MSKINRPPVSIAKIARQMKKSGREGKIIVIVGTVTNDDRIFDCPKIKVRSLNLVFCCPTLHSALARSTSMIS